MTAKEWLMRVWKLNDEISALLEAKRIEYERCISTTSAFTGEVVKSTKCPHKFDKLTELEIKIDVRIDRLYAIKTEILEAINSIENITYRTLLIERYINCKTWEKIAVDMNYSYSNIVHNLHPKALAALKYA